MAHFAKVINGLVENVIVADQEFINSGAAGDPTQWVQTSYNTREGVYYDPETQQPARDQSAALRKNFAAIGGLYDIERDAFLPPKPFESWVLREESCTWWPPVEKPIDGRVYVWDEPTTSWVFFERPA